MLVTDNGGRESECAVGESSIKSRGSRIRLGIDGIVDILQAHFATISGTFRSRSLQKRHKIHRYSPDGIIDP
jgi:hypothetical protein